MTCVYLVPLFLALPTLFPAQSNGSEETSIRDFCLRFAEAYSSGKAAAVAGFYTRDGDRINADLETAKGRTEIAAQYQRAFSTRGSDSTTVPPTAKLTIRLADSEVAILDGEIQFVQSGRRFRRQFTAVLKKEPSGWLITAGRVRGLKEL
jgi:uncharacterized protein (TIGR02246 family)